MYIEINAESGFCYGVVKAIQKAEKELNSTGTLYCLGDIVHNGAEIKRLEALGLTTINHEQLKQLHDCKVLIRAHGEPPSTYQIAQANNIELIDASCPVVMRLQQRIKNGYELSENTDTQMVIYGKTGHAEVNGLVGQVPEGHAIVINDESDLDKIDYTKPIQLFSQTTKSIEGFQNIQRIIKDRLKELGKDAGHLKINDTICRQVANRVPNLKKFAAQFDVVIFVSGKSSSNGKQLFEICKASNERTYFYSGMEPFDPQWIEGAQSVGICGATSTPRWLMEQVEQKINQLSQL